MDNQSRSLLWDMFASGLGWMIVLLIDPGVATFVGIPVAIVLIVVRRTWWKDVPLAGRINVGILLPIISLSIALVYSFGQLGLLLGLILSAALVGLLEGWSLRNRISFVRRFPGGALAVFLILASIITFFILEKSVTTYPTEEFTKVLSVAPNPPEWSADTKKQAVGVIREVIADGRMDVLGKKERELRVQQLSSRLRLEYPAVAAARAPRSVFVTLYGSKGEFFRDAGSVGIDPVEKLVRATIACSQEKTRMPRSKSRPPQRWKELGEKVTVQVDVQGRLRKVHPRPAVWIAAAIAQGRAKELEGVKPLFSLLNLAYEIEVGVDGVEFFAGLDNKMATVLPADPVSRGWLTPRVKTSAKKIATSMYRGWKVDVGERLNLETLGTVRKFRTSCFGQINAGDEIVDWFRGNVLLGEVLSEDQLVLGITEGADWLARQVVQNVREGSKQKKGQFRYEVYPPYRNSTDGYNLPRHAGSIYGLFAMARLGAKDSRFKHVGRRSLRSGLSAWEFVEGELGTPQADTSGETLCFLEKNKDASSGSTALAAMALLEMPTMDLISDPRLKAIGRRILVEEKIQGMGRCLLKMIDDEGAVFRTFSQAVSQERVAKEPLYFPGEVMLALVRMHQRFGDPAHLEAAKKIGERQLRLRSSELFWGLPLPGDHWITQASAELALATQEKKFAELSLHFSKGMLREMYPPQAYIYPDYRGSFRRIADLPRTTRAASRGEALGGGLKAARFLGKDTEDIEAAILEGARHLLEQQFSRENSFFAPIGQDIRGAIRMGLVDNHCRIDNNQHAVVALLHALEVLNTREK